jgi:hypothetical protein
MQQTRINGFDAGLKKAILVAIRDNNVFGAKQQHVQKNPASQLIGQTTVLLLHGILGIYCTDGFKAGGCMHSVIPSTDCSDSFS